jgi:hypothetical protein
MKRWAIVLVLLIACGVILGGIVFLVNSGSVVVITNLSSGQDDSFQHPVGYKGAIVKGSAVWASMVRDRSKSPPLVNLIPGTHVKVLVAGDTDAQVEVLDGPEHGIKPWIRWEDME